MHNNGRSKIEIRSVRRVKRKDRKEERGENETIGEKIKRRQIRRN